MVYNVSNHWKIPIFAVHLQSKSFIMRKLRKLLPIILAFVAIVASSCVKDKIEVSEHNVWFGVDGGTKTLEISSTFGWRIAENTTDDWFTVTPSGSSDGNATVTITAQPLDAAAEGFRRGSITFLSPRGGAQIVVIISQGDVEFSSIYNLVFGLMKEEQWNTDYYGLLIEDSYKCVEFDPYDTTGGFMMYFLEDGVGVQVDRYNQDTAVYYRFDYTYNIADRKLDIRFELADGSHEIYSPTVITATTELFRFEHEYKAHYWERSDMRKIGVIDPAKKAMMLNRAVKKRKEAGPVFPF